MRKQTGRKTTWRMTDEDEAAIATLRAHLGKVPVADLLRDGLKLMLKKHRLSIPVPKKS